MRSSGQDRWMRAVAAAPALASAAGVPSRPYSARYGTELARTRGRLVAACVATALAPALVIAHASARPALSAAHPVAAVQAVVAPLPAVDSFTATARSAAATCPGLPSQVLVAVAQVESGRGEQVARSSAGAVGPMQFLPSTWAAYGTDGDGDGVADVMNPTDALYGAARLLCANGGGDPARLRSALWNYNHSDDYVSTVLHLAGAAR